MANFGGSGVSVLLGRGDGTFQPAVEYDVGDQPTFVAVGDLTGDALPDLAVANSGDGTVSILLGRGDGSFQVPANFVAGTIPSSAAVEDVNGDARPDLVVTNSGDGTVSALLNSTAFDPSGAFPRVTDISTPDAVFALAVADLNRDGKVDLVTGNMTPNLANGVSVLLGKGDGTFGAAVDHPAGPDPAFVAVGDLNRDGRPDLITENFDGTNDVSVLLGNGDGTVAPAVDYNVCQNAGDQPSWVTVADVNRDGKPDLALAITSTGIGQVTVLLGNGDGTFQPHADYAAGIKPSGVAVVDVNGDGKPDLLVSNTESNGDSGTVSVLLGNGDGTFQPHRDFDAGSRGVQPLTVVVADLNRDGKPDLAVANFNAVGPTSVAVLLGNGDGSFQNAVEIGVSFPTMLVVSDANRDGKPDLLAPVGGVDVLLNTAPTGNLGGKPPKRKPAPRPR